MRCAQQVFGTRVHTILKDNIAERYSSKLAPERSYLKYFQELNDDKYGSNGVDYGTTNSLRHGVAHSDKARVTTTSRPK